MAEFAQIVDVDPKQLSPETELATLEGWDSVAYLSTMVLIDDKLGITLDHESLVEAATINDILSAVGTALEA